MLSNVLNAGKDLASKIGNKLLNLSEVETLIKEATNDDAWGPQGSLMKEIAEETFSSMNFNEMMTFLWYRIFTERPVSARRTYKGLVLLSYIILNGSDYVAIRCKDHLKDIRRLEYFSDANGIPDASIRKKARDICDLLNNPLRLSNEKEKAKTNQMRFYGPKGTGTTDSMDGDRSNSLTTRTTSLGDFDSWEPRSKSIPAVLGETFINFVNTFTQNISGPPPTETHDNYDMPGSSSIFHDENMVQRGTLDQDFSSKSTVCCSSKESGATLVPRVDPVLEMKVVEEEGPPIIDFSDNCSGTMVTMSGLKNDFSGHISSRLDDDFGDFSSWTSEPGSQGTPGLDFFPDFDRLQQNPSKKIVNIERSIPETRVEGSVGISDPCKTPSKVGSTWNDMGNLKIDLDNLCGARRSMWSKS